MIPVNRIKRWPFPGNPAINTLTDAEEVRVDGEEMLSVYGALTMALGFRDGKKIFDYLKRLATQAAEQAGGVPCIFFEDAMGEFGGAAEQADETNGGDAEPGEKQDPNETEE
jgi:hypothetical protein